MSTKNNPSVFDCYENLDPNEPYFVLMGRDKHAAALVRCWAEIREREGEPKEVVDEAKQVANELEIYAIELNKPVLSLDSLIAFAIVYKGKQEEKRQEEQAKQVAEAMAMKWNIGDHAMTMRSRNIGNIEYIIEGVKDHPTLANVRFSPQHMMTVPIESLRKPTDEELAVYYQSRGIR